MSSTADIATVWTRESRPVAPASSERTIASTSIVTLRRPSDQASPSRGDDDQDPGGDREIESEIDRALCLPSILTTRAITACVNAACGCTISRARAGFRSIVHAQFALQIAHDATCAASSADSASESSAIVLISGSRSSQRTSAILRFEQVPQAPLRPVEVRHHHRHVQRLGEIFVMHALQIVPVDEDLHRIGSCSIAFCADPS